MNFSLHIPDDKVLDKEGDDSKTRLVFFNIKFNFEDRKFPNFCQKVP